MEDYYEILGITDEADSSSITTAYRQLALLYHPDKNRTDTSASLRFAKINEAYRLLIDPAARTAFNRLRAIKSDATKRQEALDSRRKALREELLQREEEYKRHKYEVEKKEAEKQLEREIARVRAEAELVKIEQMKQRGEKYYTKEELTLRYVLFDKRLDLQKLYPNCSISRKDESSGLLEFPDIFSATKAMSDGGNGLALGWFDDDYEVQDSESANSHPTQYDFLTDEELEERTIKRLQKLAES